MLVTLRSARSSNGGTATMGVWPTGTGSEFTSRNVTVRLLAVRLRNRNVERPAVPPKSTPASTCSTSNGPKYRLKTVPDRIQKACPRLTGNVGQTRDGSAIGFFLSFKSPPGYQ